MCAGRRRYRHVERHLNILYYEHVQRDVYVGMYSKNGDFTMTVTSVQRGVYIGSNTDMEKGGCIMCTTNMNIGVGTYTVL
jgi:hypothetical protein